MEDRLSDYAFDMLSKRQVAGPCQEHGVHLVAPCGAHLAHAPLASQDVGGAKDHEGLGVLSHVAKEPREVVEVVAVDLISTAI